jgi:hypothetical protein
MRVFLIYFFDRVVAKVIWRHVSDFLGFEIGTDYLTVASKWLHKEKFCCVNIISSAVLRSIWLVRNDIIFRKQDWSNVKSLF